MISIQKRINVSFEHRICFTEDVFNPGNPLLLDLLSSAPAKKLPKVLVVLDDGLQQAQPELIERITGYFAPYRDRVDLVCPPILVKGGERVKNTYFHVSEIQSEVDRYGIDRHSFLVAIGGGALLDVAGLAAATAHRGVQHIRIPSTTLSQADSGIGIKNGINAFGKKNFIGSFAVPSAVINDLRLLTSQQDRDKRAGYSEAVKVACIKDRSFFEWLEENAEPLTSFDPETMRRLVFRSAELHVNHIAEGGDPFEMGSARPLDFGHWAAHQLEQLSEYRMRHGEAVAVGIAIDTLYSRLAGFLSAVDAERILALLRNLGFTLFAPELLHTDSCKELRVLKGLEEFRVHLGGQLTVTLLRAIGQGFEVHELDRDLVAQAIGELASFGTTLKQPGAATNHEWLANPLQAT